MSNLTEIFLRHNRSKNEQLHQSRHAGDYGSRSVFVFNIEATILAHQSRHPVT